MIFAPISVITNLNVSWWWKSRQRLGHSPRRSWLSLSSRSPSPCLPPRAGSSALCWVWPWSRLSACSSATLVASAANTENNIDNGFTFHLRSSKRNWSILLSTNERSYLYIYISIDISYQYPRVFDLKLCFATFFSHYFAEGFVR